MTPQELQSKLAILGVDCRIRGAEVVVQVCRFCGNPKANLELNVDLGVFHAWCCNAGGRLDALLSEWTGEAVSIPVQQGEGKRGKRTPQKLAAAVGDFMSVPAYTLASAVHYLQRRMVTAAAAERYGLVVCMEPKHMLYGRVVAPVRDFWTGVVIGFVGRTMTNQRPKYMSTLQVRFVVGYRMRGAVPCVLVEGVFDGIAVHQAGFQAAMLLGTSAPQVEAFGARLSTKTPLYVLLDGEAVAEAERLRWVLEAVRGCPVQVLKLPPGSDPANFQGAVLARFIARGAVPAVGATSSMQ